MPDKQEIPERMAGLMSDEQALPPHPGAAERSTE